MVAGNAVKHESYVDLEVENVSAMWTGLRGWTSRMQPMYISLLPWVLLLRSVFVGYFRGWPMTLRYAYRTMVAMRKRSATQGLECGIASDLECFVKHYWCTCPD